eukprot:1137948-Pelagomonas_calceolata.AAC.4
MHHSCTLPAALLSFHQQQLNAWHFIQYNINRCRAELPRGTDLCLLLEPLAHQRDGGLQKVFDAASREGKKVGSFGVRTHLVHSLGVSNAGVMQKL